MSDDTSLWAATRAGARAGRGFRYQDAVCALLAAMAWDGSADWSVVVPEGLDDITLHGGQVCNVRYHVQAKARHDPRGRFSPLELAHHILKSCAIVSADDLRSGRVKLVMIFERPVEGIAATGWEATLARDVASSAPLAEQLASLIDRDDVSTADLLAATHLLIEDEPLSRCANSIRNRTGAVEAAARLAAHQLRYRAGHDADRNYRASAQAPATINASDVQGLLDETLCLIAPDAVLAAVSMGLCEPVTFAAVEAPDFYLGVDVTPGHIGAGLVLERPALSIDIDRGLGERRCALVSGPSGSGKSAAAWMYANGTRHAIRWYRVRRLSSDQVHLLLQLARDLEASLERPVGFVLDDVGRDLVAGWDALVAELAHRPGFMVLGTIREEDLFLVNNLTSTMVVRPALDEDLAQRIWRALAEQEAAKFAHWREPLELSQGLLLEYTHLLTAGVRLHDMLDAQVRRRLVEQRDDEIELLQAVVTVARFGGSIDGSRLRTRLGLSQAAFARALARLVDEHAVRVATDGSLRGLHQIRSTGLHQVLARQMPRPRSEEVAEAIDVTQELDFPIVLPRLILEDNASDQSIVTALAARMPDLGIGAVTGIFYGLGLAVCERIASTWLLVTRDVGLDDRHSATAFGFALVGAEFNLPQTVLMDKATARLPEVDQTDLRTLLIERMGGLAGVKAETIAGYHELVAALVRLPGLTHGPSITDLPFPQAIDPPLIETLEMLGTVREFGEEQAHQIADLLGGTGHLLDRIHHEKNWVTRPDLRIEGEDQVIASDVRYVAPVLQPDIHGDVVTHCGHLLAAAPFADVATSNAAGWDGNPAGYAVAPLATKRIPRDNLSVPVRVAWNRVALRSIQRQFGATTETNRAHALAAAVRDLEPMLSQAAEHYCRGTSADLRAKLLLTTRQLLNLYIERPSGGQNVKSPLDPGDYSTVDDVSDFVEDTTNLVDTLLNGEIAQLLSKSIHVGKLARTARTVLTAESWKWVPDPPLQALESCARILDDLEAVFGDAHREPEGARATRLKLERSSKHNRSLPRFGREARKRAAARTQEMTSQIERLFADLGVHVIVAARPLDDPEAPFWPKIEHAAFVPVSHLVEISQLDPIFLAVKEALPVHFKLAIVPVREGLAITGIATQIYETLVPRIPFAAEWEGHLPMPALKEDAAAALLAPVSLVVEISAVFANADRALNLEEETYLQTLVDSAKERLGHLERLRDKEFDPDIAAAWDWLTDVFGRIADELVGNIPGERIATDLARMMHGTQTEFSTAFILHRLILMERDVAKSVGSSVGHGPLPLTSNRT